MEAGTLRRPLPGPQAPALAAVARWWPLVALTALAAAIRFSTLDLQSFWYDEAFTPVHVLHGSLWTTLHAVARTENTPPLWYVLIWGWSRLFGTGEVALRSLSALAGVATVPVAWAIGRELAGRRAAILSGALVACNPLFVWYSQEARAYQLYVLTFALALLCFLRAERRPTAGRMAAFALCAALALVSHYFAVFMVAPMALWLARKRARLRIAAPAVLVPGVVGAALIPLVLVQGGHGTQWIGRWALASRLESIPQNYLTGYTGARLGHSAELVVAVVILAGVLWGLWRGLERDEERGALIALAIAACGVLIPIAVLLAGADYLAPRNLIAAMIPVSALLAVVIGARRAGATGMALAALLAAVFLALSIDINLSPRLQRGNWRGLARALGPAGGARAVGTPELGGAPLLYYVPSLSLLRGHAQLRLSEIDEVGYAPLRASAGRLPAPGFHLAQRRDIDGLIVYRFTAPAPVSVSSGAVRHGAIVHGRAEVLIGPAAQ